MRKNKFEALYYPYADISDAKGIIEYALYFDSIYILEPNFFKSPEKVPNDAIKGDSGVKTLINENVIKPIGPELIGLGSNFGSKAILYEENKEIILQSIKKDLENKEFINLAANYGVHTWKIPTGQQLFWNGIGLLLEVAKESNKVGLTISTDRPEYYKNLFELNGYDKQIVKEQTVSRLRGENVDLLVDVPFVETESLMLTVTLLACMELGLYPVTDSVLHHNFLKVKLRNEQVLKIAREAFMEINQSVKESLLVREMFSISLPRVSGLSIEKVLKLREKCNSSLMRFRTLMKELRYKIESEVWSKEHEYEVSKLINTEIAKSIADLKESFKSLSKDIGIQILEDSIKSSPLPLVLSLTTGFSPAIALAASGGLVALTDFIKFLKKRNELKNNSLFFLLDLDKRI